MSSKDLLQGKREADSKSQEEDKDVKKRHRCKKQTVEKCLFESYNAKNLKTGKYMQDSDSDKNRRETAYSSMNFPL